MCAHIIILVAVGLVDRNVAGFIGVQIPREGARIALPHRRSQIAYAIRVDGQVVRLDGASVPVFASNDPVPRQRSVDLALGRCPVDLIRVFLKDTCADVRRALHINAAVVVAAAARECA